MEQQVFVHQDYELLFFHTSNDALEAIIERLCKLNLLAKGRIPMLAAELKDNRLIYEEMEEWGVIMPTEEAIGRLAQNEILLREDTVRLAEKKKVSRYSPVDADVKGLYTSLNKIVDEKELLSFSKLYGLPAGLSAFNPAKYIVNYSPDDVLFDFAFTQHLMNELNAFKEVFTMWRLIQKNDLHEMQDQFGLWQREFEILHGRKPGDIHELAEYVFNNLLARPKGKSMIVVRPGKIRSKTVYYDLFELAYAQLYRAIRNNADMKLCKNCTNEFEVVHANQEFCPPNRGKKNSTCQNTYNMREKRRRKSRNMEV